MKTTIIIIAIVVLGGLGFWAMTNYQNEEANTSSAGTTVNNLNESEDALPPATNSGLTNDDVQTSTTVEVSIDSTGFTPSTVTISAGDTVTWTNEDSSTHYVAPDSHPSHVLYAGIWPDDGTGRISGGETYSFTFGLAGTYDYHDHLSASLTGTVIVQ